MSAPEQIARVTSLLTEVDRRYRPSKSKLEIPTDEMSDIRLLKDLSVAVTSLIRAQSEREKVLALALRRLTYWAQTSGGTAGRDDGLVAAIDVAVEALRAHDAALKAAP